MRCGVLALQGDFGAHGRELDRRGVGVVPVRSREHLCDLDGMVLPGGESTAMLRLLGSDDLHRQLALVVASVPILATCAGLILLAREVRPAQPSFGTLDVTVERNAYGRQRQSRIAPVHLDLQPQGPHRTDGVFIRAPRILRVGDAVTVLGRSGDDPVLVRQGHILAATYHPELGTDPAVHDAFVAMMAARGAPPTT